MGLWKEIKYAFTIESGGIGSFEMRGESEGEIHILRLKD